MIFRFVILGGLTIMALEDFVHAYDGHSFKRLAMGVFLSIVAAHYAWQIRQLFVRK